MFYLVHQLYLLKQFLNFIHFFPELNNMQTAVTLSVAVAASLCISTVLAYPNYKGLIPNGGSVPSPCPGGGTWGGVGHNLQYGTGPLNPFGVVNIIIPISHAYSNTWILKKNMTRTRRKYYNLLNAEKCRQFSQHLLHASMSLIELGYCENKQKS